MGSNKVSIRGRLPTVYDLATTERVLSQIETTVNPMVDGFLFNTTAFAGSFTLNGAFSAAFVDATAGTATVTLGRADALRGMRLTVKKTDASANPVLVTSASLIDGVTVQSIGTQYASLEFLSENSGWWIV